MGHGRTLFSVIRTCIHNLERYWVRSTGSSSRSFSLCSLFSRLAPAAAPPTIAEKVDNAAKAAMSAKEFHWFYWWSCPELLCSCHGFAG
eukprot:12926849-Prorocentrum_lima.AAC.1